MKQEVNQRRSMRSPCNFLRVAVGGLRDGPRCRPDGLAVGPMKGGGRPQQLFPPHLVLVVLTAGQLPQPDCAIAVRHRAGLVPVLLDFG